MNVKKVITFTVLGILFVFAIFCFSRAFVSMGKDLRELRSLRTELQRATERERELTAQLELVNKQLDDSLTTIRDSQARVREIQTITERSSERFRYGFEELGNLRRAITEAEGYYKDLESQLDLLSHMLNYNNSNLENH